MCIYTCLNSGITYIGNNSTENLNGQKIKFSNLMAELIKYSDNLLVANGLLYIYDETVGCYKVCIQKEVAKKLRTLLEEDDRLKVTSRQYKEAYEQLLIAEEVQHDVEFFANEPYVNCLNGVYDVREGVLKKHSAKYYFKHVLNAEFDPDAECPIFMDYIETITQGDKELKKLIQVVMGYILSHYNNSKIAVLLYGVPHTGKSVLCKIITDIIGEKFVSNVDLAFLEKQEYAAALSGMLVNIAPDLKNEALKDPGFFKSLVSHNDTVNARLLYHNTGKVKGETKMIFCSNHLVEIGANVSSMDAEAVFNRLLYIPFQNSTISEEDDNKNIARDIVHSERNGVFRWAMEGLKEYIDSGETFPKCKLSEEVKAMNMAHYCPEQVFWKMCIKKDVEAYVSTKKVKEAFERFCADREVKGRYNIGDYIKNIEKIPTERISLSPPLTAHFRVCCFSYANENHAIVAWFNCLSYSTAEHKYIVFNGK